LAPWQSLSREEGGREEARDVLGRDTREISAEIHKYKESVALLTRTLAELGQEVGNRLTLSSFLSLSLSSFPSLSISPSHPA
jgi:hypothetical protein